MALVPDPKWRQPAKTWEEVIRRYVHFRRVKAWRGRQSREDGLVRRNRMPPKQAQRLLRTLLAKVNSLVERGLLPKSPYPLRQETANQLLNCFSCSHREFDRAPSVVRHLWRALIFNGGIPVVIVVVRLGTRIASLVQP